MSRRKTPGVIEVHCDGPERHLNVIDRFRAKSMAGERCQVDRNCQGRIRLDRPIAEPVEEVVPRIPWVIGSIALVVVSALWICLFLAYGTNWNLGGDRARSDRARAKTIDDGALELATKPEHSARSTVPTMEPEPSSAPTAPAMEPEQPAAPNESSADKGSQPDRTANPGEIPESSPRESTSTSDSKSPLEWLQPIAPERMVPFLKRVPLDPRGGLVLLAVGVLFVRRRVAHAMFGVMSAITFMIFGALLGEEAALWSIVFGFLIGTIDAWRITRPRRRVGT